MPSSASTSWSRASASGRPGAADEPAGVDPGPWPTKSAGHPAPDDGPPARRRRRAGGAGADADVRLPVDGRGAAYLGGTALATLAAAGRVAGSSRAVARADAMFHFGARAVLRPRPLKC